MKRATWILLAVGLLFGTGQAAKAGNILLVGSDMDASTQAFLATQGYSSTIVSQSAFSSTSFSGYTGIWIGWFSNISPTTGLNANLQSFISGGGKVLVETPFGNTSSFLPGGSVTTTGNGGNSVHILNPSNPLNAGLTDGSLSSWNSSFHDTYSAIGAFTALTVDGSNPSNAVTIYQQIGSGLLVLTGQDIALHEEFGSNGIGPTSGKGIFVNDVFSFSAEQPVPEPSTFAIFGMMLALGAGCYFYRRQRMFAPVA